ncbi:MAG: hypothetical protein ACLS4A_12735 [Oscillospiraceae bacterium]
MHYKSLADLPPGIRQQVAGKVAARAAAAVAGRRESKYHNEPVTVKAFASIPKGSPPVFAADRCPT